MPRPLVARVDRTSWHRAAIGGLVAVIVAACTTGCSRSVWETAFTPERTFGTAGFVGRLTPEGGAGAGDAASADAPVDIRTIPWERMQDLLDAETDTLAASDTHPDDWTAARRLAHRAELLEGLQVAGDPARIAIVGRSVFRALGPVRPLGVDRDRIAAEARRVGATDVVVATTFLGRVDTIVDRPITVFGGGGYGHRGRRRSVVFDTSTAWVPVRTEADQIGVVAFFLRRADAGASARPAASPSAESP